MQNAMNQDTIISNKTLLPIQSVIPIIVLAVGIVGTYIRSDSQIKTQAEDIAVLQQDVKNLTVTMNSKLELINGTLNKILTAAEVKNAIDEIKISDRWTAAMMVSYNEALYSVLRRECVDLDPRDMPDVQTIKQKVAPILP